MRRVVVYIFITYDIRISIQSKNTFSGRWTGLEAGSRPAQSDAARIREALVNNCFARLFQHQTLLADHFKSRFTGPDLLEVLLLLTTWLTHGRVWQTVFIYLADLLISNKNQPPFWAKQFRFLHGISLFGNFTFQFSWHGTMICMGIYPRLSQMMDDDEDDDDAGIRLTFWPQITHFAANPQLLLRS